MGERMKITPDQQKDLARRIGYNPDDWDRSDEESRRLYKKALEAQLSGCDNNGQPLSIREIRLLAMITGRTK